MGSNGGDTSGQRFTHTKILLSEIEIERDMGQIGTIRSNNEPERPDNRLPGQGQRARGAAAPRTWRLGVLRTFRAPAKSDRIGPDQTLVEDRARSDHDVDAGGRQPRALQRRPLRGVGGCTRIRGLPRTRIVGTRRLGSLPYAPHDTSQRDAIHPGDTHGRNTMAA